MKNSLRLQIAALCAAFWLASPAWAVEVQKTKNEGVEAWLVEEDSVPVVHVALAFKDAGYASDPANQQGRAEALAAMLMEGAGGRDARGFHQALEEKAISISMDVSRDMFVVRVHALAEHREAAFALLRDALTKPEFAEASLQEVKARQLARLRRSEEQPNYVAGRALASLVYGNHPYAQSPLGDAGSVQALNVEQLREAQKQLSRDRLIIGAVGALDKGDLDDLLEPLLEALPESSPQVSIPDVTVERTGQWREIAMDIPQTIVMFATQGVTRNDKDFYAAYVMNHILGGSGLTARLSYAIREQKGLTYYAGSELDVSIHAGVWQGMFATRATQLQEALDTMEETVQQFATQGATQQELDSAIGYITGSFPLSLDSSSAIASYLVTMQLYDLGADYLDKRNDYFKAVTLEQVNQLAASMLDPKTFKLVRAGGASAPAEPEKAK